MKLRNTTTSAVIHVAAQVVNFLSRFRKRHSERLFQSLLL